MTPTNTASSRLVQGVAKFARKIAEFVIRRIARVGRLTQPVRKRLLMNNIKLFHGDCLEILPSVGPVDTVITDPVWPNAPADMFPNVTDAQALLSDALNLIDARRVVIIMRNDSDPRFLQAVPKKWDFFRAQILSYVMPGFIGRKLGGDEFAYCFGEPLPVAPGRRVIPGWGPKVQPDKAYGKNGHPCSRSLAHIRWLVNWWSLEGETVLDPFMGSGTTGVACKEMGRNFIGIELDEKYFKIAETKVAQAMSPLSNNASTQTAGMRPSNQIFHSPEMFPVSEGDQ